MSNILQIINASPENANDIIRIQKTTWMDMYVNPALGITEKDIKLYIDDVSTQRDINELKMKIKNDREAHIWIVKDGNKVVGYIGVVKSNIKNIIGGLHILPSYQRRGIGTKLMEKGLEWLGKNSQISLQVIAYNEKAIRFYKSFGFIENGFTSNHKISFKSGIILPQIEMIKNKNFKVI